MVGKARTLYRAVRICALPVCIINNALGTELEPGEAWLSREAHRHIAEDHREDYPVCFPILEEVISRPTWIGQAHYSGVNCELVARKMGNIGIVLAAICLEPNKFGNYNVCSVYRIEQKDVDARRASGRLILII